MQPEQLVARTDGERPRHYVILTYACAPVIAGCRYQNTTTIEGCILEDAGRGGSAMKA
jgi:hypothetical protein